MTIKHWLTMAGLVIALVVSGFFATSTFAQNETPPAQGERPERGERGPRENGPLSIVADALGMTTDELVAALDDETSIADVADAQGVDVEDVVDALMERAADHMQVAVEHGRLTQEAADARLAQLRERVTERINEPGLPDRPARGERGERGERPER